MEKLTAFAKRRNVSDTPGEVAGKTPSLLITDGLPAYRRACVKKYRTNYGRSGAIHVREIRIAGRVHNNKMERMNGEVRDREKTFRGLKSVDSPILKGYQIFHNFVRPHEALDGDTPADRCGIKVEGASKWLTIIQNASRNVDGTQGKGDSEHAESQ